MHVMPFSHSHDLPAHVLTPTSRLRKRRVCHDLVSLEQAAGVNSCAEVADEVPPLSRKMLETDAPQCASAGLSAGRAGKAPPQVVDECLPTPLANAKQPCGNEAWY